MAENDLQPLFLKNERLAMWIFHLLAAFMLALLTAQVVVFSEAIVPSWQGGYLVPIAFLAALEGMIAHRRLKTVTFFTPEWFLYRGAELVVLLVGLKLVQYIVHGFELLVRDIPRWREDFLENFFTSEYVFTIIITMLVWGLAAMFASELHRLEGDRFALLWTQEDVILEYRPEVRRSLANIILSLGAVMIFLAAMLRLEMLGLGGIPARASGGVLYVFVFFLTGLVLLSLTQISVLRTRWALEHTPISERLTGRWLLYSMVFLALLGLVSFLLPTQYSIGFLDMLGWLISVVLNLLGLLLLILLTPLFLIFGFLARLLGNETEVPEPNYEQFMPPPPPTQTGAPLAEFIKSLIFWLIFLGVVGFSLVYYLRQNQELLDSLRQLPLIGRLIEWGQRFWRWLGGVNETLTAEIRQGLRRLQERQGRVAAQGRRRFVNLRRLSPRERVLFYYLALVRRGSESGLNRKPGQTPYEYSRSLRERVPEVDHDLEEMTESFVEARYSRHDVTDQSVSIVKRAWERVRRALRGSLFSSE